MEAFRYGVIAAGHPRHLLFERLADTLYSAPCDVPEPQTTPLGIRQGARIYYRHSELVAVAEKHQALLAARDHWPLSQALEAEAAARLAAAGA
jgi:hypothetical protein